MLWIAISGIIPSESIRYQEFYHPGYMFDASRNETPTSGNEECPLDITVRAISTLFGLIVIKSGVVGKTSLCIISSVIIPIGLLRHQDFSHPGCVFL